MDENVYTWMGCLIGYRGDRGWIGEDIWYPENIIEIFAYA